MLCNAYARRVAAEKHSDDIDVWNPGVVHVVCSAVVDVILGCATGGQEQRLRAPIRRLCRVGHVVWTAIATDDGVQLWGAGREACGVVVVMMVVMAAAAGRERG